MIEDFDPVNSPLKSGINLIEASAGTGKTYAIAMLVLRFIVERKLDIKSILVVTFTKAACEELKTRIRNRLSESRQAIDGKQDDTDKNIVQWLDQLPIPAETIRQRIDLALSDIDLAGIFTIHSFCQRILTEYALESGQLFDCELTGNIRAIRQSCADDFWRKQLYLRSPWQVSILSRDFQTPDDLLRSIETIDDQQKIYPHTPDLNELLSRLNTHVDRAGHCLDTALSAIQEALSAGKFKAAYQKKLTAETEHMHAWLKKESLRIPDFSLLTDSGLTKALDGRKFKKPADEDKTHYIQSLGIDTEPFSQILDTLSLITLSFRQALLQSLRKDLGQKLQQLNIQSFDDLIRRMAAALKGEKGHVLIRALQQQYQAAFIDEFQDTDQSQWFIFSTLFNAPDHALYLIGDPKQAIYKFRGADIFSYFNAQKQAHHFYTLKKNWRSHPHLVNAINRLFRKKRPFLFEQLDFKPVSPALSIQEEALFLNHQRQAPLQLWQLEKNTGNHEYWTAGKAAKAIQQAVVIEMLHLLSQEYCLSDNHGTRRLLPKDIAILVRTNTQAKAYQQALSEVGITAVLNAKESVFSSFQANELYIVLRALAQPGNIILLKQALAISWFQYDGQQLHQLSTDERALDEWVIRFQTYHQEWQRQGLMSMMKRMFREENLDIKLAKMVNAERILTNINHLVELLQQASIEEHLGINKTLKWLHHAMLQQYSETDDQIIRLESDEDAARIITMHGAKGLEYPVVFCPCLWERSDRIFREKTLLKCHKNGEIIADLGSDSFEEHRQLALQEELAEDLRLFYVAVTRAKTLCYICWADVRNQKTVNQSAMAWLLELAECDFSGQQARLQSICAPENIAVYRQIKTTTEIPEAYQPKRSHGEFEACPRIRNLHGHWQMSSYTALSALSVQDTPELPNDRADEIYTLETVSEDPTLLPKGARTGNVLHELLEKISFSTIATGTGFSDLRDSSCLKYGLHLETPERIDDLLQTVVNTPLSETAAFRLANIADTDCLKEMPFYLSLNPINIAQINDLLKSCPVFQPLSHRQMSGYLTGFIDLICRFENKYFLIDYKSNTLDDYYPESLAVAMREHNYGLQYWLYTLVLHQYLSKRLPGYNYKSHFGGVKYLFLRGMSTDQPGMGIYTDQPDLMQIEKLADLFFSGNAQMTGIIENATNLPNPD